MHPVLNINTCHLIRTPNGRYSFVGAVPAVLCNLVAAGRWDIMAGRTFRKNGKCYVLKPKSFDELDAALAFVRESNAKVFWENEVVA